MHTGAHVQEADQSSEDESTDRHLTLCNNFYFSAGT